MDWMINGLPLEGDAAGAPRAIDAVSAIPACQFDVTLSEARAAMESHTGCVVVNDSGIVVGLLRAPDADGRQPVTEAMRPGPATFRPGVAADELAQHLREHDLDHALLTTAEGRLVGVATRPALESLARPPDAN